MEKGIIKKLQRIMPDIMTLSGAEKSLYLNYDKEADVLYISFQKPQRATDTEFMNDDILIRRRNNTLVGITIMHASKYR